MNVSLKGWEERVGQLINKCADQVLGELEEEIMAHLRAKGRKMMAGFLEFGDGPVQEQQEQEEIVQELPKQEVTVPEPIQEADQCASLYALAVIELKQETLPEITGMEESLCTVVQENGLGMLVCPVPEAEYNEEALHLHMEDMPWVESHARRHEEILLKMMESFPVIPMPFCTIFRETENIRGQLRENYSALKDELHKVTGHQEMYLKLFVNPGKLLEKLKDELPCPESQGGSSYFQRKQWEKKVQEKVETMVDEYGEALYQELKKIVAQTNLLDRSEVLAPNGLRTVFAAQFLLAKAQVSQWNSVIEEFDQEADNLGFVLEVSGPWPLYHFSNLTKGEKQVG